MSIATRSDQRHGFGTEHDAGLDHPHDWARELGGVRGHGPVAPDASAFPAPSSTRHDDALYA